MESFLLFMHIEVDDSLQLVRTPLFYRQHPPSSYHSQKEKTHRLKSTICVSYKRMSLSLSTKYLQALRALLSVGVIMQL